MAAFRIAHGLLLLFLALVLPAASPALPLEVPALVLLLALAAPHRLAFGALAGAATLLAGAVGILKLADLGTGLAFSRPFNPWLDLTILVSGWHLLSGTIGQGQALAAVTLALLAWLFALVALAWGLGGIRRLAEPARRGLAVSAALLLTLGVGTAITVPAASIGAPALPYLAARGELVARSVADLSRFEETLAHDPLADVSRETLLSALREKDVILLFVESYGRAALDDPRYAGTIRPRLLQAQDDLARAGIGGVSGWLTSPTVGGQSWFAHGALLSGLWTHDQSRYDRMIASRRESLVRLFREAGWRTVGVMPAITMDWPEGGYFGYDAIHAKADLGYRGPPFDWVTMPDQYTLSAIRRIVEAEPGRPTMVEAALISSHAPWTPIPRMVPWDAVGDGRIFAPQVEGAAAPEALWRDPERVRRAYRDALDYSLEATMSFIARFGRNTVFIVVGDHQPAALVTGPEASRDVPLHILSDDPAVLDRLADWGWTPGLLPAQELPPWRMDAFRERFVRAFSGPAPRPER